MCNLCALYLQIVMPQVAAHDFEMVALLRSVAVIGVISLHTSIKALETVVLVMTATVFEATVLELTRVSTELIEATLLDRKLEWTALVILSVVRFAPVAPK